jgi:hypothetical protein
MMFGVGDPRPYLLLEPPKHPRVPIERHKDGMKEGEPKRVSALNHLPTETQAALLARFLQAHMWRSMSIGLAWTYLKSGEGVHKPREPKPRIPVLLLSHYHLDSFEYVHNIVDPATFHPCRCEDGVCEFRTVASWAWSTDERTGKRCGERGGKGGGGHLGDKGVG